MLEMGGDADGDGVRWYPNLEDDEGTGLEDPVFGWATGEAME